MIRAAIAALFLTAPAHALTMTEMGASLDACFTPSPSIGATLTTLSSQGWVGVAGEAVTDEVIENLIWSLAVYDLSGDVTKDQLTPVLESRRATIADLVKSPDATGQQNRILTRMVGRDRETVIVSRYIVAADQVQTVCRFTLSSRSVFGHAGPDFETPNTINQGSAEDPKEFTVVLLNLAKLNAKTQAPVPTSATVETNYAFNPSQVAQ